MIIKKIRLKNFGVYAGEQAIDLTPPSREKPIILLGGLNGGGKTTLIDAVQLALFGKLSRCSNRGNLAYDEFLRRSISRGAGANATAAVGLEIRQNVDGTTHDFVVERSWSQNGKGMVESLSVTKDNVFEKELAEDWLEYVDQFIPVGLAELFFFDGEKIARLAEAENSAQMLSTAIGTLLGIDLVDRLERDLTVYERGIAKERRGGDAEVELGNLDNELKHLQQDLERLTLEQGHLQNQADKAKCALAKAEEAFRRQGGNLLGRREKLKAEYSAARTQVATIEKQLQEIAAGIAPLAILKRDLERLQKQAAREEAADRQKLMHSELEKRDKLILARIKRKGISDSAWKSLKDLFTDDRNHRLHTAKMNHTLDLEKGVAAKIQRVTAGSLDQARDQAKRLIKAHERWTDETSALKDRLEQIPDDKAIAEQMDCLREAEKEVHRCDAELAAHSKQIQTQNFRVEECKRRLERSLEQTIDHRHRNDDVARKLRYSAKVRTTMKEFRRRVLEQRIRQIEGLILESFQQLLRKKHLLSGVRIDPVTYTMSLVGHDGVNLPPERLSAGERQLLAVSTLWGLAKASGRPLPNIIDTPLARLDSQHRLNVVENYFPNASHQVVILSTDEEVNETCLPKLKPRIGRSYELRYSTETDSTTVAPGYFFS